MNSQRKNRNKTKTVLTLYITVVILISAFQEILFPCLDITLWWFLHLMILAVPVPLFFLFRIFGKSDISSAFLSIIFTVIIYYLESHSGNKSKNDQLEKFGGALYVAVVSELSKGRSSSYFKTKSNDLFFISRKNKKLLSIGDTIIYIQILNCNKTTMVFELFPDEELKGKVKEGHWYYKSGEYTKLEEYLKN